jgi:hypothetical protein
MPKISQPIIHSYFWERFTTTPDTVRVEVNRPERVPMMREIPKKYVPLDCRSALDREIPQE